MANGFVRSIPASRHGDGIVAWNLNMSPAQKFTCPGSGTILITRIGLWVYADATKTTYFRLAIFSDDAANACPNVIVTNSDSGELSTSANTNPVDVGFNYVTQPSLTGGTDYWLAYITKDSVGNVDKKASSSINGIAKTSGITYPTWPTADAWHTHTDQPAVDLGIYAVYIYHYQKDISHDGSWNTMTTGTASRSCDYKRKIAHS